MRTVGVSPGTYTLQISGLGAIADLCPPDEIASGAWGTPYYGWYDSTSSYSSLPDMPAAPAAGPGVLLNVYGTESGLEGALGYSTWQGIGLYALLGLGLYGAIYAFARRKRRRR